MTNTICIIKCSKGLSNKSSNGIMPKQNINFQTQRFYSIHKRTWENKRHPFFHKNTVIANIEIQLMNSSTF